jgi:DNA-binding CsgD family transcriptional regulator
MMSGDANVLVDLRSRLQSSELERQVYAGLMDRLQVGIVILDEAGCPVCITPTARDLLEQADGLRLSAGRVHAVGTNQDRDLQQAIRDAVAQARLGAGSTGRALSLSRPSGLRDLGVVIQGLPSAGGAHPSPCAIAMFIRDPERSVAVENEALRNLFGLTPAEAEVARKLTEGLSLEQAAQALHISRNTARAHLRSIFSKSGITRQSDLVRILLNSAAVLGVGRSLALQ